MPGLDAVSVSSDESDREEAGFENVSFGFQLNSQYNHSKKFTDIVDVTYNARLCKFVILDTRGLTSWSHESNKFTRDLNFPKYQSRLLRSIIFCEKYHVYFAICNDFTLQVFNKEFHPTCKTENVNMRSILHMVYNSKTDELITTGVGGTTVWQYKQTAQSKFDQIKSMANYSLIQSCHHKQVGGSWCTKIILLPKLQQLYFCSENDLYVYSSVDLKPAFHIKNAHAASVTCAGCCKINRMVITGSLDTEVKVWGSGGGYINTFRGHSQPITSLIVHSRHRGLVITSSLDGTVKVWSLNVMEMLCSLSVFEHGIDWMDVTPHGKLWCGTEKKIVIYKFNSIAEFWGHTRCKITSMTMKTDLGKSNRVVAIGEDGSVRMFNPRGNNTVAMCTALPPPVVSLMSSVMSVAYSRRNNLIFMLIDPGKIWVYTTKTDPSCRIAEWDITQILDSENKEEPEGKSSTSFFKQKMALAKTTMHKPLKTLPGYGAIHACSSLATVHSEHGFVYNEELGRCCPRFKDLLLLGLQDGRIFFMDQVSKGLKYFELAVSKDPVLKIEHDANSGMLYTTSGVVTLVIQIWSLPELRLLMRLWGLENLTAHGLFSHKLVTGHADGVLIVTDVVCEESLTSPDNFISKDFNDSSTDLLHSQMSHRSSVIDIQACLKQKIFATCSSDGVIKVWNFDKILLTEVCLDGSLTSCCFLNNCGDLLAGWKNHIYIINRKNVSSYLNEITEEYASETDSVIYEDPSIKYDLQGHDKPKAPINMENYLVPYDFILKEKSESTLKQEENLANQEKVSVISDSSVHAPTDLYKSPAASVDSFLDFDDNDRLIDYDNWLFPHFGKSPGPSPADSVESVEEIAEAGRDYPRKEEEAFQIPEFNLSEIYLKETSKDSSQQLSTTLAASRVIAKMKQNIPTPLSATAMPAEAQTSDLFKRIRIDPQSAAPSKTFHKAATALAAESRLQNKSVSSEEKSLRTSDNMQQTLFDKERSGSHKLSNQMRRPKKVRKILSSSRIRSRRRSSSPSITLKGTGGESPKPMSPLASPSVDPKNEKVQIKATTMTLGSSGVQAPYGREVSIPGKPSTPKYKHENFQRPFKQDSRQGLSKPRLKTNSHPVVKKRSVTRQRSSQRFPKKITLTDLLPSPESSKEKNQTGARSAPSKPVTKTQVLPVTQDISQFIGRSSPIPSAPSHASTRSTSRQNSSNELGTRPVTEVSLVHKNLEPYKNQFWKPEESVCDNVSSSDDALLLDKAEQSARSEKVLEKRKPQLFQTRRSLDSTKDRISRTVGRTEEDPPRPYSSMGEIKPHHWLTQEKRPSTYCGERYTTSDEEYEDLKVPTLVDYHNFPIYKNDGLQFDESWQDRMLERYLLLKQQREERQLASAKKRAALQQNKKYKILANKPELTYGDMYEWYQDHTRLADYILNSPLLSGDRERSDFEFTPRRPIATPLSALRKESGPPLGRPPSAADSRYGGKDKQHPNSDNESSEIEQPKSYRFSIRPHERGDTAPSRRSSAKSSSTKSLRSSRTRLPREYTNALRSARPASTASNQLLLLQRPRSSASIPGKTRYVLVKAEDAFSHKLNTPTPSKMEEDLLKKRFPMQHQSVVKAMKKLRVEDSEVDITEFDDWNLDDLEYPTSEVDEPPEELEKLPQPKKSFVGPTSRSSASLSRSTSKGKIHHDTKQLHTRRSSPSFSSSTPYGYSPISVLHRKTTSYVPTTFKA